MILPSKEFLDIFKNVEGALSCTESIAIMNIASQAPEGLYMECGVYKGKSAMSAMQGLKSGTFVLVDTAFINDEIDFKEVEETLNKYKNEKLVIYGRAITSLIAISSHDNYSYCFIDSGSHGDGLPMQEVKLLEDRIVEGGIIAFHDYKNQFTEVEQAYNYLLSTDKFEEIQIAWQEIFDYVKENNLEDGNNSWHQYPDLPHPPNFVGALKRK